MNPVIGVAIKDIKSFFREKGTIFWTIAFPVLMMLIFAAIFGREIPFSANLGVVNLDNADISAGVIIGLNHTEIFNVKIFENESSALKSLNNGDIRAYITIPKDFSYNITHGIPAQVWLVVDETDPDVVMIVRDGIKGFFSEFYKQGNPNYKEPINVVDKSSIVREKLRYIDYILPGLLCYPLLFSSMVVSTGAIVYEREKGTLKRIRASPAHPLSILFGKTLAALMQTAISILIIALLAIIIFNPKVNWNTPLLIPTLFLGSVNGIAIGLLISCVGKSPAEASNAATTIGIILQFFTGMYFPLEYLPSYLQTVGKIIPMTYAAQAVRDIMIKHADLGSVYLTLLILGFTAVSLYAIGILSYKRWVEKE